MKTLCEVSYQMTDRADVPLVSRCADFFENFFSFANTGKVERRVVSPVLASEKIDLLARNTKHTT